MRFAEEEKIRNAGWNDPTVHDGGVAKVGYGWYETGMKPMVLRTNLKQVDLNNHSLLRVQNATDKASDKETTKAFWAASGMWRIYMEAETHHTAVN